MGIHGDSRHGQSLRHRIRRLAPTLVASVCVVAGSSWARTPGVYFGALQAGNAAVFDNVPVLLIRTYLNVALATYEKECPETAPSYARPWALAAYVVTPAHANSGGSGLVLWTAANGSLNSWTSDAENDVRALKEQAGCSASAHRAWVANAKAMAQDSRVAGPFPQARELCEQSRAAPTVCACFSNSYDMEATPAERRRVRDARPPLDGLRATLRDSSSYLSSRVSYKCETSPPIASPATEYLYTSDEHHRLKEGTYRVFHPLARAQAGKTCRLTRNLDWRYTLACLLQPTGQGTLSSAGDMLAVHYKGSKPDDAFSVLADGTLRLQSRNPQVKMDLLPGAAEGDTPAQDAGGAVGRDGGGGGVAARAPAATRGPAATPEQCAKMAADLQMLRSKPTTLPRVIANHETRYARYCGR